MRTLLCVALFAIAAPVAAAGSAPPQPVPAEPAAPTAPAPGPAGLAAPPAPGVDPAAPAAPPALDPTAPAAPPVSDPAAAAPAPADPAGPPAPPLSDPAPADPAGPPAPPLSDPAPATSRDRALLEALLALSDADADAGRSAAARALGELGDERAVLPLVSALRDPVPEVRAAAALGLGAYPLARAQLALTNVLAREHEELPVQVAALRALGRHRTAGAGEQLLAYYKDRDQPAAARTVAEQLLAEHYPELLAAAGRVAVVESKGRLVLVPAAAGLGAYALGAVGSLGVNSDTAVPIGIVGGLVLGGGAAYLITADASVTMPQGIWFATTGGWGLTEGLLLGSALQPDGGTRVTTTGGLVGELAGFGLYLYSGHELALRSDELVAVNLAGVAGVLGGLGLSLALDLPDEGTTAVIAGSSLAALTASALAAPHMEVTGADAGLVAVTTAHGVTVGALLPVALGATGDGLRGTGCALLGGAVAYGATAAATPFVDSTAEQNVQLLTLPGFGYLAGGGIPLLFEEGDAAVLARSSLGGAALGTAGALLSPEHFRLDPGDGAFVPFVSVYGLWQGAGWALWLEGRNSISSTQAAGLALASPGLAGWAAVAAARPLDVEPLETLALSSGAFWGIWYSGFLGYLLDANGQQLISGTLLASDAGLLGAIGLLALDVDESRIGIASAGGLTGAAVASLGAALATRDGKQVAAANLLGTTLGLAGGALLGGRLLPEPGGGDGAGGGGPSSGLFLVQPGVGQARGARGEPIPLLTLSLAP